MTNLLGQEIRGTRFTFEHQIQFTSGTETQPYRSTRTWKTVRGALRAAEAHAKALEPYYTPDSITVHALVIYSDLGEFVTNEAA